MIECRECTHPNPPGARFCAHCGARLPTRCPSCHEPCAPEQRFCTSCGTALGSAAAVRSSGGAELAPSPANYTPAHLARRILADRQQLRGERKHVTVLFCDLADSTTLASALGAEDMHAFLSAFFETVLAEVHRFEGTVNQFLGDGFMAIFGAPLAYEDHAARAGLAALAIAAAIERARLVGTHRGWSSARVRMGLNSGEVVVGTIGDDLRMDYTAAGDTTHLAARLQGVAQPGEILCGAATVEAARGALDVTELTPVVVKGIAQPVLRYRLVAAREHTLRPVRRQGSFLGRDAELAALNALLQRAARGQGGVVEVEGEPGAGKSRLMLEFLAQAPAPTARLTAQCITYGNQRPNAPILELVAGLLAIAPGDATGTGIDSSDYLRALLGDMAASARLGELDPATARGRTRQALLEQVQRVSVRTPLLIVIEDLHWADPSTLEFLSELAVTIRALACLMVVTFRPGSDPPWPASARLSRMRLAPLDAAAAQAVMRELVTATVLSAETQAQVLTRAEGNPFFLEELVRAAVSTGEQVPGDVFDVIGARIDRLAPADKLQLRAASVLGREFSLDLLEEIVHDVRDARPRIERLETLGFVEAAGTPRRYRFVHALTQEVAYQTMLGEERRFLHGQAAERLAARAGTPEESCEEIAHHHLLGRSPALALPYLETATAKAIRNHTLEAAYEYLTEAMRLFEAEEMSPERLIRCVTYLLQAFPVFHFLHKHREYAAYLQRYAEHVEALQIPALLGPFLAQRGHRLWVEGRYAEAEISLLRAIPLCEQAQDPVNAAHAALMLAWVYANSGNAARNVEFGERSLQYLQQAPIPLFLTFTNVGLLMSAVTCSRWDLARCYGERARDVGVNARDDGMASFGGAFLAWVHYEMGDDAAAIAEAQKAFNIAPTQYFKGWAATYMATAMARSGQAEQAIAILDQAVEYAKQAGHLSGYALVALLRAEAIMHAGQYARAVAEAIALHELVLPMPYPYVAAGCLLIQAECELREGSAQKARDLFTAAAGEFEKIQSVHRHAQAQQGVARAAARLRA